jgi:hypothetical protein
LPDRSKEVIVARELFFYNAATGNVASGRLSGDGNFTGLTTGGGLSKNWTHVNTVSPFDLKDD